MGNNTKPGQPALDRTVGSMVLRRVDETPAATALRLNQEGRWQDVTWRQVGLRMQRIAAGLMTALDDLPERAAITVIGNSSYDWIACDFAALSIGLRTVPVYATLVPAEVGYLHTDTGAVIAIVEDAEQLDKVRAIRDGFTFFDVDHGADEVKLRHIVVMNPSGLAPADDWESLDELEARGAANLRETAQRRSDWGEAVGREDVCTYTYTSGTTGPPKGVIQTNHNMLSMVENIERTGLFRAEVREGGVFLFLPLAHSFGRLIQQASPFFNAPIIVSGIPTLATDLLATRPGFFPAAPRVYEKMRARILSKVAGAPPLRQKLFKLAMDVGASGIPYRTTGRSMPVWTALKIRLADRVVLSKLRAALGLDRTLVVLSGSAPLAIEVQEFFLAMGLDLIEAYGLTETCPGLTANLPGETRPGTVGRPMPGVEIRIASDGEILARGDNISAGYLNRPDATEEAFSDGWFHTGDLGSCDTEGFVRITGRKKELMKTSGGKFIAPAKIEGMLKNHPLVQEAVVVADLRNFASALIAVDPEELAPWAEQQGVAADPGGEAVTVELQRHVDAVNTRLARFETIKQWTRVAPLTVEDGMLTASLKVKRSQVVARYADLVDAMYGTGSGV